MRATNFVLAVPVSHSFLRLLAFPYILYKVTPYMHGCLDEIDHIYTCFEQIDVESFIKSKTRNCCLLRADSQQLLEPPRIMRRRTGVGRAVLSALTASLLVFPLLVASQQPEQRYYRKSPHEEGPLAERHTPPGSPGTRRDENRYDTTNYKHLKDTSLNHERASAIATTVAPAADNRAVRALQPARGSGKSAGISSPHNARSLQDWEVEDFILLATVDGSIHARDRKTGAPRWELEVDRPMVETIYHPQNKSKVDGASTEYDFLWIVEPSRDGDIYIYNQGLNGGLQRLHMTVKQLVEDMSPYESIDPAVVYNAEKKTKLYTVDAGTGSITKIFGSGAGSSPGKYHQSCPKPSGLEGLDEEECGPSDSFVLGRTEYTITIQNRDTTEPICTLMYSEWGPNIRDEDLHRQYSSTMDNKYVYSLHDGSIFGWDYAQLNDRQRSYTQKLPSPVVRVFDVARPLDMGDGDTQLVVLPQPVGPVDNQDLYNSFSGRNRIFVNHTEAGGWFAMSENTYPLVTGRAKPAQCYDKNWVEMIYSTPSFGLAQRQEGLVGVHAIADIDQWRGSGLTISGPAPVPEVKEDAPVSVYTAIPPLSSLPVLGNSRIIGSAAENFADILVAFLVIIFFAFLGVNRRTILKFVKQNLELKDVLGPVEQTMVSVPSSPIVAQPPWVDDQPPATLEVLKKENGDVTPTISRRSTLLEPPPRLRSRANTVEEDRGRTENGDEKGVRFEERSPAPNEEEGANSPQPGKKKARRGIRGGVKHRKKSKQEQRDEVDEKVQEIMQIAKEPQIEPLVKTISPIEMTDVSSPLIQIGHLKVYTDTVLGHGSHGTMVFRGSFGNREVAVKRMLQEFYEIASHEVGLLTESDDHPNVIRYFDKESAGEFLYIALELCPASLQDVIEKPQSYPNLIGSNLDLPDVLKQITAGVQYLHSLKIVHRDIKPQNILVSAPKLLPPITSTTQPPRILISDFGLCKKLEGDQNSFRATTAHAAGTSGWRAPELLVDEDLASPPLPFTSSDRGSEPLVLDPQTNRRATRAIDIFSLGCVFYYVLTSGNHPFDKDGKYMREANIVKGAYHIDDLANLGDYQWEAKDLISSMLSKNPRDRPDAATILTHPFFWSPDDRLDFLCHVSDGFEFEPREPPSAALAHLESYFPSIVPPSANGDFLKLLPKEFKDTLGKQRKYNGGKVLDLLRALRNKKNHYEDMPEGVREKVGGLPAGYLGFWTRRFPGLLICCQRVVGEVGWGGRDRFRRFYGG